MLILGGMIAGLSGAILVGFINLWAPGAWGYAETIVLFAAIIVGGAGNHKGAVLGALLVPLGFEEATRFIPPLSNPALVPALEWVAIGLLIILFLWFRPDGILPERRRILSGVGAAPSSGCPSRAADDPTPSSILATSTRWTFASCCTSRPTPSDHGDHPLDRGADAAPSTA